MNAGESPKPIAALQLRELWVHTGTTCNLSCPFCHEGSKPGDRRLEAPSCAELEPLFDAAVALGAEQIAFTGGEPLIHREIHAILGSALQRLPALVLTNGTAPFIRRTHQLESLRACPHPLRFRVSIDHADEARHDAGRGYRNFRKALEGLRLLLAAGFEAGITRQQVAGEDPAAAEAAFRALLRRQRLPADLPVVALPELGALGEPPPAGTAEPSMLPPARETACARSRMLLRRGGELRLAPCPLVDDNPAFDAPAELESSLRAPTIPVHPRCRLCLGTGVNYIGAAPSA